jgi:hypothetical protein
MVRGMTIGRTNKRDGKGRRGIKKMRIQKETISPERIVLCTKIHCQICDFIVIRLYINLEAFL